TIGGTIAFFANLLLWPSWEKNTLPSHMIKMVKSNANYFEQVMHMYTQEPFVVNDYKLARKDSNVSAANLMSAFQRMLSEPKSKQKNGSQVYHFVVVNNSIVSHIAALANYGTTHNGVRFQQPEYKLLSNNLQAYFSCILEMLERPGEKVAAPPATVEAFETLDMKLEAMYQKRQEEVNNGQGDTVLRQEILEVKQVRDQLHAVMSLLKDMKKTLEQNS
ncbi:MAG: protein of unknown function YccS/YhfK, partial [Bacteroidetes bacterium]|nr:protein of unknown function YccS/YhfK [Bacteroidota bacterium]